MLNLPIVLVVDDEVRSQETLRRTLEDEFEVLTATQRRRGRAASAARVGPRDPVRPAHAAHERRGVPEAGAEPLA